MTIHSWTDVLSQPNRDVLATSSQGRLLSTQDQLRSVFPCCCWTPLPKKTAFFMGPMFNKSNLGGWNKKRPATSRPPRWQGGRRWLSLWLFLRQVHDVFLFSHQPRPPSSPASSPPDARVFVGGCLRGSRIGGGDGGKNRPPNPIQTRTAHQTKGQVFWQCWKESDVL